MDESLDSEAEARSEGRRPELRADRGPARGRPLLQEAPEASKEGGS